MSATETAPVTREELIARARAMIPSLRARSDETYRQRQIPAETVEEFKQAGFIRMVQSPRFGGMGHDLEVVGDVAMEIARGCGSTGWMSAFWPIHQFQLGWFSEQAQEEYFANSPDTVSSTINAFSSGDREDVPGGVRVSGTWNFSSGIDHAEWALVQTRGELCLIPASDYEIVDNWHVSGLAGTGSKAITITDAFVPAHRIVTLEAQAKADYPDGVEDSPWYRLPRPGVYVMNHFILAPVIGMARGVLDLFDERVRTRRDPQSGQPALERPGPQLRFAEAAAEIDAAEMFWRRNIARCRELGERGAVPSLEFGAALRRDLTYAAKLCQQATNRLVDGMDSSALYDVNLVNRQARDVRAGGLQFVLHWEETAMQFSRVHWGLEPQTVLI
jgi:3-hydroxy-9,10-secoandrosta-1,3,5(10)-triene-9,17-dione monooxygenase